MVFLGQDREISHLSEYFVKGIASGIFCSQTFDFWRNYLNAQSIFRETLHIQISTLLLHLPLCYFLSERYRFDGIIYAVNISYLIMLLQILVYIFYLKKPLSEPVK